MDRSELLEIELATLFGVSRILGQPRPLEDTLARILQVLHDRGELLHGMVSLVDPDSGALSLVGTLLFWLWFMLPRNRRMAAPVAGVSSEPLV